MIVAASKPRKAHNRDCALGDTRLIGLAGHAHTGKDTAAAFLVGRGWTRLAFADEVKAMALDVDPIVDEWGGPIRLSSLASKHGWENAKAVPEVRRFLQRLGTEGVRARDPEFWTRIAMQRAAAIDGPVVFTDVRFANEADAIRTAGGTVVHVTRPLSGLDGDQARHASEVIDFPVDGVLVNDGTLDQLEQRVALLVDNL